MTFNHKFIFLLYKIKTIFFKPFFFKNDTLRILIYHDIKSENLENFKNQIIWLKSNYNIISPKQFEDHISKKNILKGKNLLITFDDGFYSNFEITINFLNKLNIKAIYFVIPDFLYSSNSYDVNKFILERIFPNEYVEISSSMKNMTIEDLKILVKTGHTIGAHTKSHSYLSKITNYDNLELEMYNNISTIEDDLNTKIKHFAYPFGTIQSVNKDVILIAKNKFDYLYTGLRGDNNLYLDKLCILRDSISPNDSIDMIKAFLSGTADIFYKKKIKTYHKWYEN